MKHVKIPETKLNVSKICYGAAHCAFEDEEVYFKCLDCFVEYGGNFLDTANIYGKWLPHGKNSNEIMLGRWMSARKNRESIILASKAASVNLATLRDPRMSYEEITEDVEESLGALQTDYLDILWMHRDAVDKPVGEIMDILTRVHTTGKVRYFGCSNWKPDRISQALEYSKKNDLVKFIASQPQWSLAVPNESAVVDKTTCRLDEAGIKLHTQTGLTLIPFSSQASGFFTKLNKNTVSEDLMKLYGNESNMRIFKNMKKLSEKTGYTLTEISLAYLMSYDFLTIPIIGSRTPEQIKDSVSAADIRLTGEEMEFLFS